MNQKTTRADMNLMNRLFIQDANADVMYDRVPLSFKVNGKEIHGIPAQFKRSYSRERIDTGQSRFLCF